MAEPRAALGDARAEAAGRAEELEIGKRRAAEEAATAKIRAFRNTAAAANAKQKALQEGLADLQMQLLDREEKLEAMTAAAAASSSTAASDSPAALAALRVAPDLARGAQLGEPDALDALCVRLEAALRSRGGAVRERRSAV